MCGIFAYIGNKNNAGKIIIDGLKSLEYRGYDSWGMVLKKSDKNIFIEKHVGKIGKAQYPKIISTIGIGHTRWATHGGVLKKNSHPHGDCNNKIFVVHNGIVENFSQFKNQLIKNKHYFKSDTDSEVIIHLIEEKIANSEAKKAILSVFKSLTGLNAIILFVPNEEKFYAIKNGSPIVFGYNKNEMILASDSSAILPYSDQLYFLEDNQLLEIGRKDFKLYNNKEEEIDIKFTKIKFDKNDITLGKFDHYMIKEINEQPKVIRNIINTQLASIEQVGQLIKKSYGTYLVGCGSAFYASLAGTYIFSKIAKRHINASVGSEFNYLKDFLKKESLVIALSQSGETIDIISSIKKAKEKETKIVALTNVLGSTLYRMADYKLLLNAGPEKCVLATKSFTAKIAYLYLVSHYLANNYDLGKNQLSKAVKEIEKIIDNKNNIKKLAKQIKDNKHIFIIGRGVSYPTALESALKIKEVSYIHAEGIAAGELKHGVIALIEKGIPVIVYNPEDETYEDTLSSAYEIKARGGYIIGISSKNNSVYDEYIEVKNCGDATIIPNVVVAQLLGYYLALEKGFDPDKPRNLAKSVTVK